MTTRNILSGPGSESGAGSDGPSPAPPAGSETDNSGAGGARAGSGGGAGGLLRQAQDERTGRIKAAPDPERDLVCARLPLTDLGNAERWRVRHGADFRFCDVLGWFAWDGRRWNLLSEEKDRLPARVMQSVFMTVRAIRNEAALVAASGYPTAGLTAKQEQELGAWAEAHGTTSYELYLAALERAVDAGALRQAQGERDWRAWIEELEPMDIVLGKTLWSQKIAAFAKTSEGAGRLGSVAALAKSFPDVAIEPEQLDAEPRAINVSNGTLRFKRASVKRSSEEVALGKSEWKSEGWKVVREPHRREDLITKLAPVKYAPSARCEAYDAFIETVQPEGTMRRFVHQWGGYSLTGDTTEQKLAFFFGSGRNGKGTWVEAVAFLAGDYAGSIPIESFLDTGGKRRGDQATPDIARLPGVRFLRVSEPEKGSALNEGLVKQVTGGDPVDARHLNKGFFTFTPDFKMTISGNHKPRIKDTSDGIWRRMQLVPWAVQIAAEEVDRKLGETLRGEASGILNRLLGGLLDWLENGLIEPEAVRRATRAYRDDSDDLGRFLGAVCEVADDPAVRCGSKELHELYQAWAEAAGGATWHIKAFKNAMIDKGFEQLQSDGMKWLKVRPRSGITLDAVKRGEWANHADGSAASEADDFGPDLGATGDPFWDGLDD